MRIYIDFDGTLFDSDKFLEDLFKIIDRYGISRDIFKECQNQCKNEGFNPNIILDLVKKKMIFDDGIYLEINQLMNNSSYYLYRDSKEFLEYLNVLKYQVIILTKGNFKYQKEKIFNSQLNSCYNKIVVTLKHKGNLNLDYKNCVFIDDNPKEIQSIIKREPKLVIRVQRDGSKYSNKILENEVLTVKSLMEIINKKLL